MAEWTTERRQRLEKQINTPKGTVRQKNKSMKPTTDIKRNCKSLSFEYPNGLIEKVKT